MNPRKNRQEFFMDTIKHLNLAIKCAATYPGNHPVSFQTVSSSYETLINLLDKQSMVTLGVLGKKLMVDDALVKEKNIYSANFVRYLRQRAINSITFYRGLLLNDFRIFLAAMIKSPSILSQEGGVASVLTQNGVSTIKLNEVKYGRISGDSQHSEDTHAINHPCGKNGGFGDNQESLFHILDKYPQQTSDPINEAPEANEVVMDSHGYHDPKSELTRETMHRIATELITEPGITGSRFMDTMTSILSKCEEDILVEMSQAMEVIEGEKGEIMDGLVGEFFYDAIAKICVDGYREKGHFDVKFVEGLIPSVEEREKRLLPHLRRKLMGFGTKDEGKIISDLLCEKPEIKEEKIDHPQNVSSDDDREKIKDEIARLLAEGKSDVVNAIVKDLSKRLDDASWKMRKKVAERLLKVSSVLDEFDKLKENFRDISEALVKRLKQENHSDIYLIASENLHRIYTSKNRVDSYFTNETLGRRLFDANRLSEDQLQKALMARKRNGKSLQYNLGALNYVDEAVLTHFLAQQYRGCQTVNLSEIHDIPENILKAVPVRFVRDHLILPFRLNSGNLYTATMNPNDLNVFNDIRFISGYSVVPHLAAEYHLLNAIKEFYGIEIAKPQTSQVMEDIAGENDFEFSGEEQEEEAPPSNELKDSDAPVVRLVNLIIKSAITQKASDIHIEPYENELRVRLRIDGTLATLLTPSIKYANVITSRIKIMSRLDISERRLPQDGRFKIGLNGNRVDFRVSTFPGIFGEKVVLRLLDSSNLALDINNLGLNDNDLTSLLTAMYKSKGMILVTGPTGSGKTTTLYSMLQGLNDGSRNISTAEDPVEYNLKGINQFQMKSKIGLDFARALRTFLRQDPDIIMVGEIRDLETAEIAVKAALTGHLVLSTLHTNSAPETIMRLLDMGIEPYLLISSLNLVVAQRLMRKICPSCKVEASANDLQLKMLEGYGFDISDHKFFKGEGCEECNDTGYKGRVAVYEVMPLWQEIQELILQGKSSVAIQEKAEDLGLVALPEQGFNKVIEGVTSLDEWMRVVA
jgi:type IV pilus assembly protein PilB